MDKWLNNLVSATKLVVQMLTKSTKTQTVQLYEKKNIVTMLAFIMLIELNAV